MKSLFELQNGIDEILARQWEQRDGTVVPSPQDVQLGNHAVNLNGSVLYADLADSTGLVQRHKNWFAAEIYKMYLLAASELIKNNGGQITAFDGDRVMGVFLGESKNSSAAKCALQINHMVLHEINPRVKRKYTTTSFDLKHAVGIDTSPLFVARTGVWGNNDLVWIGRAANYAAKLCALRTGSGSIFITSDVYNSLSEGSKFGGDPKRDMWTKTTWDEFGIIIYQSSWSWRP